MMTPHDCRTRLLCLAVLTGSFAAATPAPGQDVAADENPLAGPKVVESTDRARDGDRMMAPDGTPMTMTGAIYGYTFDGELVHPETSPEEAALEYLDLTPEQEERINAVLLEWSGRFDAYLLDRATDITRFQTAFASLRGGGRPDAESRRTIRDAMRELLPLLEPSLADGIREQLTADQLEAFDAMLEAYDEALVEEAKGRAEANGRRFNGRVGARSGSLRRLGRELRDAYERTLVQSQRELDEVIEALDLSPASESDVRRMTLDFAQREGFNASSEARLKLIREIYAVLQPDEQQALIRYLRERSAENRADDRNVSGESAESEPPKRPRRDRRRGRPADGQP